MALREQQDTPRQEPEQHHTPHDFGDFFRSWIRDPRGIGAERARVGEAHGDRRHAGV